MAATDPKLSDSSTREPGRLFVALATAALLALAALLIGVNSGGSRAGTVQVLAVLVATAVFGRAAYNGTLPRPLNASLGLMFMALFTGLTALSVGWSLVPNDSMLDALRLISYTSVLALGALLAQMHQIRAREILLGLGLAALIITIYSLSSRCFPGLFSDTDNFARLRLPFGYWNAVGCLAALGLVAALWAGTRRCESRWIEVISYPAGGLFAMSLMLSQSRGALIALAVGLAVWFLLVPMRLRSVGWLAAVGALSAIAVVWAYSRPGLTTDALPIDVRESVGWKLFGVLVILSLALATAGWLIRSRRIAAPLTSERRRSVGKLLLILLAISPFVLVLGVGVGSDRGFSTFSDSANDFFTTSNVAPGNSPARLTQTNSLRGRYWSEAYKVLSHHTLHGTGADTFGVARLQYRSDLLTASHAHGMVPQVAADLGILGLLVLLGLTIVWLTAAFKLGGAARRAPWHWLGPDDEVRLASVGLMIVALVFGAHSAIDWIWFVPGVAFFGLIAGGWVLGSPTAHSKATAAGPVAEPIRGGTAAIIRALAITIVGVSIAWAVYQPVRATHKVEAGLEVAEDNPEKAIKLGNDAIKLDPTNANAYMLVAAAQNNQGHDKTAEGTLLSLVSRQPGNPAAWMRLAQYRLVTQNDPEGAIQALRAVLYLSPVDVQGAAMLKAARQQMIDNELEKIAEKNRKALEKQLDELEKLQQQLSATGA
ncbi:MAG: O-antigen ligase family protein [Solirubrobacterales bacterium]